MNGYTNGTTEHRARLEGRVLAVKGNGLKLGETWFNLSKWHEVDAMPRTGDAIVAHCDKQGFIRRIELVGDATPVTNGAHNDAGAALSSQQAPDMSAARIAALAAAVGVLAAMPVQSPERQNVDKAGDAVIALAAKFAEWVQG